MTLYAGDMFQTGVQADVLWEADGGEKTTSALRERDGEMGWTRVPASC